MAQPYLAWPEAILNSGCWIGSGLRAGLRRFMAESKRNAEGAEVAERSAEADRLGNYLELQRCWKLAPASFLCSASVSASSAPPRFDSIRLEDGKRKGEHPTSNILNFKFRIGRGLRGGRQSTLASSLLAFSSPMPITNVPFISKNRHFYSLKNFAPLRLCARKLFIGIEWIGSMVLSCQRCRGVKIASRKGAKAQRKMQLMVDWYAHIRF